MYNNSHGNQVNAYKMARATVSKTRQVVMLYEGVIKFMMQAREAMEQKNIEERFKRLSDASEVLLAMQNYLDFDRGGNMAHVLYDFYSEQINAINKIHNTGCVATCDRIIAEMKDMLDTWRKIDVQQAASAVPSSLPAGGVTSAAAAISVTISA